MDSKQTLLAIADALRSRYSIDDWDGFEVLVNDREVIIKGIPQDIKVRVQEEIVKLINNMSRSYSFNEAEFPVLDGGHNQLIVKHSA